MFSASSSFITMSAWMGLYTTVLALFSGKAISSTTLTTTAGSTTPFTFPTPFFCYSQGQNTACNATMCAGNDDQCYDPTVQPYQVITPGTYYKFRNSMWPEFMLALPYGHPNLDCTGKILSNNNVYARTTNDDASQWQLVLPPSDGNVIAFIFYNKNYPKMTIQPSGTGVGCGFGYPGNTLYSVLIQLTVVPQTTRNGSPLYTITSFATGANLQQTQSSTAMVQLFTTTNDPGAFGYWYCDPPLPASIQAMLGNYSLPFPGAACQLWPLGCGQVTINGANHFTSAAQILLLSAVVVFNNL
jgi:hypothetical protein